MTDDIDDVLGYDVDHNDSTQYCEHGTFIGSWWGPDYLCGWCEEGITVEEIHKIIAEQRARADQRRQEQFDRMIATLNGTVHQFGWNARLAHALINGEILD